jgi:FtsZ-binding cell division protein ZapB
MDCYTYTKDEGMVATISGPWVLFEEVEPIIEENQKLVEEASETTAALFTLTSTFEKYRAKTHDANNEVQIKLSQLEVENLKLKTALKRMLDFEMGSIQEAKALLIDN